ncbi:MAG: hypothetical protein C4547_09540 [Phycisphaerales bacterium]|nr:MAG: hypothetical protein C4547_09540 [Phycisphaerales bacterium]
MPFSAAPRGSPSFPLGIIALAIAAAGGSCGVPSGSTLIDTSVFDRTGFSRFSMAGSWVLTTSDGQTRRAEFDGNGALTRFTIREGLVYEPAEGDTLELLITSFGVVSFRIQANTEQSSGFITVHHFEGTMSDEDDRIRGDVTRLTHDLAVSRPVSLRETWVKVE